MNDTVKRIERVIRDNYVEDFSLESDEASKRRVGDILIDSITMLEFFMILEEEFGMDYKISSEIDIEKFKRSTVKEAIGQIALELSK